MKRLVCYLLWHLHYMGDAALFVDDGVSSMDMLQYTDAVVRVHYGKTWVTWWEVSREPWQLHVYRVPVRLITEGRRTW